MALQKVVAGNKIDFEQVILICHYSRYRILSPLILQIARELRCARAQCIQTEVQYLYIHRVMIENALLHINLDESTRTTGHKFLQDYDNKMRK